MENIGIYKIVSPSGKTYIGRSKNIKRRWYQYKNLQCKSQVKLYNSFMKYGVSAHSFEVITYCNEEGLNKLEEYYIMYYSTFNSDSGLNLNSGGDSRHHSEETKLKIGTTNKIIMNTPENKRRIGDLNRGKILSEETKLKISNTVKGITYPKKYKKILQFNMKMELIKKWDSLEKASKDLSIISTGISNCLVGRSKTSGGYIWKYNLND